MHGGQLPQPLLATEGGDIQQGTAFQQLELMNMDLQVWWGNMPEKPKRNVDVCFTKPGTIYLQAQVVQQSGDNAKLKLHERELSNEVSSLRSQLAAIERGGPGSPYQRVANNSTVHSSPLLREPTEMEVGWKEKKLFTFLWSVLK